MEPYVPFAGRCLWDISTGTGGMICCAVELCSTCYPHPRLLTPDQLRRTPCQCSCVVCAPGPPTPLDHDTEEDVVGAYATQTTIALSTGTSFAMGLNHESGVTEDTCSGVPAEIPGGRLWLAQQIAHYRYVPLSPEEVWSTFERWQQAYGVSGEIPDTNMSEVECCGHATLGRLREFASPSEARCTRTRFVPFCYWGEYYENATMCTECCRTRGPTGWIQSRTGGTTHTDAHATRAL